MLGGLAVGPAGFALVPDSFVDDWFPELTNIALALIGFLLRHQLSVAALKRPGSFVIGIPLCRVGAAADLIPSLNRRQTAGESVRQFVLLVAGIATIALFYVAVH
jgi:hypothetical protein